MIKKSLVINGLLIGDFKVPTGITYDTPDLSDRAHAKTTKILDDITDIVSVL